MARRATALDNALAELARVPPRAFTKTRSTLAAQLEASGQPAVAAAIKKVPVPTLPVWTVNRLAQEEPKLVEELVRIGDRIRAAQVGRGADSDALADATAARRQTLSRLTARAEGLLREAGGRATRQALLRIQTTLVTAAAIPAHHEALRAGRLERELQAPGFAVFGQLTVVPPGRRTGEPAKRPRAPAASARAARQVEARAARERARAERAERETREGAARAERVAKLEGAAAEAARALEAARAQAAQAAQRLREATAASHAADRALAAARRGR